MKRLGGRVVLTREELLAELDAKGVSTDGQRGYHALGHLALTGTLCFGPPRGKKQTFVLLDEWVKKSRRLERDEALGELALRYFTSHGPATTKDFAGWTKLAAADVKIALAVARAKLVELDVFETRYWMAPDAEDHLSRISAQVRGSVLTLPGFDEYVLGYQDRSAVLAGEHKDRIVPGGNGMFMPTLVVRGEIVGTWRRAKGKSASSIEPIPFAKVSRTVAKAIEGAARAYARFLGVSGPTRGFTDTRPARRRPAS